MVRPRTLRRGVSVSSKAEGAPTPPGIPVRLRVSLLSWGYINCVLLRAPASAALTSSDLPDVCGVRSRWRTAMPTDACKTVPTAWTAGHTDRPEPTAGVLRHQSWARRCRSPPPPHHTHTPSAGHPQRWRPRMYKKATGSAAHYLEGHWTGATRRGTVKKSASCPWTGRLSPASQEERR